MQPAQTRPKTQNPVGWELPYHQPLKISSDKQCPPTLFTNIQDTNFKKQEPEPMAPNQDLHQRVAALSPQQRETLAQQLRQLQEKAEEDREGGTGNREQARKSQAVKQWSSDEVKPSPFTPYSSPSTPSPQRLIAYVVPANNVEVAPKTLRDALKAQLPNYMVPAAIVPLSNLPRTANGKIDTQALPTFSLSPTRPISPTPQSPTEATLAQIWQDVLRLETVGIHDNFFELGGDSILSIQIVSKAREASLRLAPNQLFEQPTIAELATVVNLAPQVTAAQDLVTGAVPLTPIQHWFFEQNLIAPHHWHQGMLIELPEGIDAGRVAAAIATLWTHHDALRLQFTHDSTGWYQLNTDVTTPPPLIHQNLAHLSAADQAQALVEQGDILHSSLVLATGGLMRAAHFTRGTQQPSWLLLSLHHLIVDAVSWQILLSDLATLLDTQNQSSQLPAKTTSFQTWAQTLLTHAPTRQSEADFWLNQVEPTTLQLPTDFPDAPIPTEATVQTVTIAMNAADTQALRQSVPAVYNTQINEVLLTALLQTFLEWVDAASGSIRVEVEGHGREPISPDIDLSRTVGWFTTAYPVRLELSDRTNPATALKSTKEQIRQIPDRGIGYGILRYLGDEATRDRLSQAKPSEVLFNYLGQRRESGGVGESKTNHQQPTINNQPLKAKNINIGTLRAPQNRRSYRLEINAWIVDEQLQINWRYDEQMYCSETIATLANRYLSALKALIAHCMGTDSGGFTPSDFPDADLDQSELDDFLSQLT